MDDFSFPTIAADQDHDSLCQLSFPHFAASPIWFMSSISDEKMNLQRRRSFSGAGGDNLKKYMESPEEHLNSPTLSDDGNEISLENEERMDMLWENFNEELVRISCDKREVGAKVKKEGAFNSEFDHGQHDKMIELCRIQVLEMTKSNSMIRRKRTSLLVMLKLLKRLFVIQKTHSSRT